jgi:hypothetical protein
VSHRDRVVNAPLFRITLDPSRQNGLNRVSQIMGDKVLTLSRERAARCGNHRDGPVLAVSAAKLFGAALSNLRHLGPKRIVMT